jgi:hypothetical protein
MRTVFLFADLQENKTYGETLPLTHPAKRLRLKQRKEF